MAILKGSKSIGFMFYENLKNKRETFRMLSESNANCQSESNRKSLSDYRNYYRKEIRTTARTRVVRGAPGSI